jgi:hypothetical protein
MKYGSSRSESGGGKRFALPASPESRQPLPHHIQVPRSSPGVGDGRGHRNGNGMLIAAACRASFLRSLFQRSIYDRTQSFS